MPLRAFTDHDAIRLLRMRLTEEHARIVHWTLPDLEPESRDFARSLARKKYELWAETEATRDRPEPLERPDRHWLTLWRFTGEAALEIREANRREVAERRFGYQRTRQAAISSKQAAFSLKDFSAKPVIQDDEPALLESSDAKLGLNYRKP